MRIFEINTVYNSGSTGRITADLKHAVECAGGECFVAYGRGGSRENNTLCVSSRADLYYHALMTRLTDRTGFYSRQATKKLIRKIQEFSPDLIHLHNLHGYFCHLEVLFRFLREYGRPVVWTLHDCWAFTGHCASFDFCGCEKWKTGCFSCPQKRDYPASDCFDASGRNFNDKKRLFTAVENLTVVTPSEWLAGLVKTSFLNRHKVRVIHNGIDLSVFTPRESDCRSRFGLQNKKILLSVANVWTEKKGFSDLLRLSGMLSGDYRILVVGLDEKQKKKLTPNMIGLSRTESIDELAELYSAADFFVNPTKEEAFGMVNVEALACGTPVITYASGGTPETVAPGCGRVVRRGDLNAMLEALNGDYSPEKCTTFASFFQKERSVEKYIGLYQEKITVTE